MATPWPRSALREMLWTLEIPTLKIQKQKTPSPFDYGRAVKDRCARGGDPIALLTIYNACWTTGCSDAYLLKAFDKAIKYGVYIISVSVDYFKHCTLSLITVGAAAIDRGFPPAITLGNIALWDLSIDTVKENCGFIGLAYSEGIVANNVDGSSRPVFCCHKISSGHC
ncbi:hypothetical protein Q3G72_020746 [Acer saccharum]|nr:hypothetical protein Q3G72_020746 [Acer saccharum]